VEFDEQACTLTIHIDFVAGSCFSHGQIAWDHPVHDTKMKRVRHLNFFQHGCYLLVRVPRVRLPDGRVVLERGAPGLLDHNPHAE
jgi:transposase